MRRASVVAISGATLLGSVSGPASAAQTRHCTRSATWTFSSPITTTVTSGTVQFSHDSLCFRTDPVSGAVTTETYSSVIEAGYTGNCAVVNIGIGLSVGAAVIVGERVANTTIVSAGRVEQSVYAITAHPVCSGVTVLTGGGESYDLFFP